MGARHGRANNNVVAAGDHLFHFILQIGKSLEQCLPQLPRPIPAMDRADGLRFSDVRIVDEVHITVDIVRVDRGKRLLGKLEIVFFAHEMNSFSVSSVLRPPVGRKASRAFFWLEGRYGT